jgi:hypothetical protein
LVHVENDKYPSVQPTSVEDLMKQYSREALSRAYMDM